MLSIHIGSQVKTRQRPSYKNKKMAKRSIFFNLDYMFPATRLRKLVDKMCKYEMDPASIVEDTGGQGETSIPHPNFVAGGVIL